MPRKSKTDGGSETEGGFVELVHVDGRKETPASATRDAQLRWGGWLPAEQAKLEAPEKTDSGSSTLTGTETTVGSNS